MKTKVTEQEKDQLLNSYYNTRGYQVGIRRLYELLKEKEPDAAISHRYVSNWLKTQPNYQINQLTRQTKHIRPISSKRKFALVQFDLIDYSQNTAPNSYKYLLTIIDVWSRYAWLIPLKNKQAGTIEKAFEAWLDENKTEEFPFQLFMSDQGGEWSKLSSLFEKKNIKYTQNTIPQSNSVVERLNQTIRRLLAKNVILKNPNSRWGLVPMVMKNYNDLFHSSIKMSPRDKFNLKNKKLVKQLDKEQQARDAQIVNERLYAQPISNSNSTLETGDLVRVKKLKKSALDKTKGFNNWSLEIYTVVRKIRALKLTTQPRFKIKDEQGLVLKKNFYRDQLLKIAKTTKNINPSDVGNPEDNKHAGITEEEIIFEKVKDEKEDEAKDQPTSKPKRQPKKKVVLPQREKSTRQRKPVEKLDL